jgi:dTMP kinase
MNPRRRGLLIALEGIDGAGKSTLSRALTTALRRRGHSVAQRREPSDARLGALAQSVGRDDPWTGAVYFTVDRYLARPDLERALARFDVVVSDRSFFSTLAYQGSALPPRERRRLAQLEHVATVAPDRVILLEIPLRDAVRRVGGRAGARGPLEERRILARVAREYRSLARQGRWVILDARRPTRELVAETIRRLGLTRRRRTAGRSR